MHIKKICKICFLFVLILNASLYAADPFDVFKTMPAPSIRYPELEISTEGVDLNAPAKPNPIFSEVYISIPINEKTENLLETPEKNINLQPEKITKQIEQIKQVEQTEKALTEQDTGKIISSDSPQKDSAKSEKIQTLTANKESTKPQKTTEKLSPTNKERAEKTEKTEEIEEIDDLHKLIDNIFDDADVAESIHSDKNPKTLHYTDNSDASQGLLLSNLEELLVSHLSQPNPDYEEIKSVALRLLEQSSTHPNANYAMLVYYTKSANPDKKRALALLERLINRKDSMPGVFDIYWQLVTKKRIITGLLFVLLIVLALLIYYFKIRLPRQIQKIEL